MLTGDSIVGLSRGKVRKQVCIWLAHEGQAEDKEVHPEGGRTGAQP